MHLVIESIPGVHRPHSTDWVEKAIEDAAGARGILVGRGMSMESGHGVPCVAITLWGGPTGRGYPHVFYRRATATGGVGYLQLVRFDGPRTPAWLAAFDFASAERVWPAVREVPDLIGALMGRADDGATVVALLAERIEALEAASKALATAPLLPGEDPAHLTGPDRVELYRVVHSALPALDESPAVAR